MPTVASKISTVNSNLAIPWRSRYPREMMMATPEAISTKILKKPAKGSTTNMPAKVSILSEVTATTITSPITRAATPRKETKRAGATPSPPESL